MWEFDSFANIKLPLTGALVTHVLMYIWFKLVSFHCKRPSSEENTKIFTHCNSVSLFMHINVDFVFAVLWRSSFFSDRLNKTPLIFGNVPEI